MFALTRKHPTQRHPDLNTTCATNPWSTIAHSLETPAFMNIFANVGGRHMYLRAPSSARIRIQMSDGFLLETIVLQYKRKEKQSRKGQGRKGREGRKERKERLTGKKKSTGGCSKRRKASHPGHRGPLFEACSSPETQIANGGKESLR